MIETELWVSSRAEMLPGAGRMTTAFNLYTPGSFPAKTGNCMPNSAKLVQEVSDGLLISIEFPVGNCQQHVRLTNTFFHGLQLL